MVSGLVKAGMALGKAQGGANAAQGLASAVGGLGQSALSSVKTMQDRAAAENMAAELGVDPNLARSVGPERMFGLLSQKRMNEAYDSRQRGLLEQGHKYRIAEQQAENDFKSREEGERLKNFMAGLRASGATEEQARGLRRLSAGGVPEGSLMTMFSKLSTSGPQYSGQPVKEYPNSIQEAIYRRLNPELFEDGGDIEPTTEYRNYILGQRDPGFRKTLQSEEGGGALMGDIFTELRSQNPGASEFDLRRKARLLSNKDMTGGRLDRTLPEAPDASGQTKDTLSELHREYDNFSQQHSQLQARRDRMALMAEAGLGGEDVAERVAALDQQINNLSHDMSKIHNRILDLSGSASLFQQGQPQAAPQATQPQQTQAPQQTRPAGTNLQDEDRERLRAKLKELAEEAAIMEALGGG